MSAKTVLLTNAQQRKTLAVARSLGKKGVRIICCDTVFISPTAFSKHCDVSLVYPDPIKKPSQFILWLISTVKKFRCDIVYPMDDDIMELIISNYRYISKHCILPVPPAESYDVAADKGKSVSHAKQSGVVCPDTIRISNVRELEKYADTIKYPVVIKPLKCSGSRGIKKVDNADELKDIYNKVHSKYPYPLIQEYVEPEERYDVCLLYDRNSELIASFIQRELRQFPLEMGPSTVQESIEFPELLESALKIMSGLKWFGIAELEFIKDKKDGRIKFMEINPRFWSSLHLSIISGVDFPWLLYRLCIGEKVKEVFEYKTGVICRWLIPGDILHFIVNKNRMNIKPEFWHGKKKGIHDDILSMEDPFPVMGAVLAFIYYLFDIKMWKHMFFR